MQRAHPELTETYYTKCFISGLKPEIRAAVRAQEPGDLYAAIKQAKYQGALMKNILEAVKPKSPYKPSVPNKTWNPSASNTKPYTPTPFKPTESKPNQTPNQNTHRNTPGAFWKCGERYFPGHQCKKLKALSSEEGDEVLDQEEPEGGDNAEAQLEEEKLHLSINALDGGLTDTTMKLKGILNKKPVMILIDSGRTHTFIDSKLVKELKIPMSPVKPVAVTIADGRQLTVTAVRIVGGSCKEIGSSIH